ncbi:molybdenum cofactor biosynthesis protein B [Marinicella sediminis]|uniref:Molybdenum cofactor biosynthesis protein B n=1 Tax=Marinicella sediminis TaxID=1792834 RepID=A0ABV7J4D4_9GAMM|nr:molybdenum cofactor biosynthesis protein B [Marinicella sediminis]
MSKTALNMAVLTVSDTRTLETDTSGSTLAERIRQDGHHLVDRKLVKDDLFHIRAIIADWIFQPGIQVVLITGGTGFSGRDVTPDAIAPLLVDVIPGFGELFRQLSFQEVGTSTIQSRAVAGLANRTMVVALPGSTGACRTAWDRILKEQLDSTHKPCNFVAEIS